jgi:NAD(P)-dependent dehydrogenase (short-subunit alcohol dehydrogenase family)
VLLDEFPGIDEPIDHLFYCPGSINLKPINSLSVDDFRDDLEINLIGAIKVIKHYLKNLKAADNASVLLFSTVAAKLGMPYHASVAASKAAVEGLVKSLGAEWAPKMRINAIALSLTDTDLAARLLRNDKMKENMVERHPLQRILNPQEVAGFANYLCSSQASAFSGQIFEMDNGIVSFKL